MTHYPVIARPNGNTITTTFQGSVVTTAKNQAKIVNGGFQNITVVGEPPSNPIPISNDASLSYVINRQTSGAGRNVFL